MIARQRQNLKRTFTATETLDDSQSTRKRLTQTQHELVEAANEFTLGASQFGPVEALDDAVESMKLAHGLLESGLLTGGQAAEEEALASLIRARKNMRQKLSDSNSASAAQCRSFDNQQAEKLRPPKKKEESRDQEQQLAQMRAQVDQLAQQQRKWSEDVRSGSSGAKIEKDPTDPNQQQQSSSQSSQSQSQSQPSLTQEQLEASASAEKLQEQLENSDNSSRLTEQQLSEAAESIDDSVAKLEEGDREAAADAAEQAAEQLEDLSEHLAAMNAADLAQQLGIAQRLAQRLADRQKSVADAMKEAAGSKPANSRSQSGNQPSQNQGQASQSSSSKQGGASSADNDSKSSLSRSQGNRGPLKQQQRDLAAATDRLAELMARLGASALDEDQQIRDSLDDVKAENPPQEIAQTMRDAADEYEDGKLEEASRSADRAEQSVRSLARGLRDARRQYTQPRLEDLIAAEAETSELAEQAEDENLLELVESRLEDLERKLQAIARRDTQLAESFNTMQANQASTNQGKANQSSPSQTDSAQSNLRGGDSNREHRRNTQESSGFHRSPTVMGGGLRDVAKVLQERIQEVILSGVMSSSDESVPLNYRDMVERYYKDLSDDLR